MKYLGIAFTFALLLTSHVCMASTGYNVGIKNNSSFVSEAVPVTYGQVFQEGEVFAGDNLEGHLSGSAEALSVQMDAKSSYPDGSVRFAVLSAVLPNLNIGQSSSLIVKPAGRREASAGINYDNLLSSLPEIKLTFDIGGTQYVFNASNEIYLNSAYQWLVGDVVTEWVILGRPVTSDNSEHKYLSVKMHIRKYTNINNLRVDFAIENMNAYQDIAQNIDYKLDFTISGESVLNYPAFTHFRHARWRHVEWTGSKVALHYNYNLKNLIYASMVPSYDTSYVGKVTARHMEWYERQFIKDSVTYCIDVDGWNVSCDKEGRVMHELPDRLGPMGIGFMYNYMGSSGTRPEIGPLPGWQVVDLLSQNEFTRDMTLTLGNLSGSWPVHYVDTATGKPISIIDKPHASFRSNNQNPEHQVIKCSAPDDALCAQPYRPDASHQPLLTYLPYIMTGDQYYLDELIYWNHFNMLLLPSGEGYRYTDQGIFSNDQVRAQAWTLRTLGYAIAVLPDGDENRGYYVNILKNNIQHYEDNYKVNQYGALKAYTYNDPSFAGWQDDFFTWSFGNVFKLGLVEAKNFAEWKSLFSVYRMGFEPNDRESFCWVFGGFNYIKNERKKGSRHSILSNGS